MDTAMIAYLPIDGSWCKQDLPHMTLVYAGDISELNESDLNAMAKDAISAARITGSFMLPVQGVEQLGEGIDAVDALVFHPTPQLLVARSLVAKWNKSQYTDFKPHATIGPVGSAFAERVSYSDEKYSPYGEDVPDNYGLRNDKGTLPDRLRFNRIGVFWGDKKLIFDTNMMY